MDGPIKKGYFIPYHGNILDLGDQVGYVNIYSVYDSVTAISAGTVVHIFTVDSSYYLTIKHKRGLLYTTYGNFGSLAVQKGFTIDASGFLGTLKSETDGEYHLVIAIGTKNNIFTYDQVVDYLMGNVRSAGSGN